MDVFLGLSAVAGLDLGLVFGFAFLPDFRIRTSFVAGEGLIGQFPASATQFTINYGSLQPVFRSGAIYPIEVNYKRFLGFSSLACTFSNFH